MKHTIGFVGAVILGTSFLLACSNAGTPAGANGADLTTYAAALSVNGDGSDAIGAEGMTGESSREPLVARGCGFETIVENVVARYDADQSGDLDESERAGLVAEFGDAESGLAAEHPNRGQPSRAAVLLDTYDSDASGTLEAGEIAALQADIEARCADRLTKLVEKFDANGDGTLDESEWQGARVALRERITEHRRERSAAFDTDADGQLDDDELAEVRSDAMERRASVEAEFDANADGQLDDEERLALTEYLRQCVKEDLPMDSREAASEHRTHGRPDGVARPNSHEADEADEGTKPAEDDDSTDAGASDVDDHSD